MSRKDVELIIRAKDEATKAVNAVTKAINTLTDSQSGLVKSAGKSDSALSRLGEAFAELDRTMRGVSATDRIAKQLDNATHAADRLEKAIAGTTTELADLKRKATDAEKATASLTAKAAEAATAIEREAAALKKAKEAAAGQSSSLTRAVADRQRLIEADVRLTQQIAAQQSKIERAAAQYAKLSQEIAKTTEPSEKLRESLARSAASVEHKEKALNELKITQGTVQAAISQTDAAILRFTHGAEDATKAFARQKQALASATTVYTELKAAAATSAKSQRDIADESERLSQTLIQQNDALNRAQVELKQLGAAAGQADAQVGKLGDQLRAAMLKDFGAVSKAINKIRAEWKQSEAAVKTLAASLTQIGPPTREQAIAWEKATTAARAAKLEFQAQEQGLQRLRTIIRQPAVSLDELRAKFQAFTAVQGQTGAALQQIRTDAAQSVAAFLKLAQAADKAGDAIRRPAKPPRAQDINPLAEAWRQVYGNTRTAMSWTQRLRGEVLSLVAAYGGIYGVINLLGQAVSAFQKLEAAQSRLGAVFNQDESRVSQELDFIRRNADRLGIEFGQLADEYTKFAAATKGTNLEGQETRRIFIAVAEAARVNKLSFEDVQGVFRALTQIASKGRIQLEELSGQLGDRLPGALKIMADGLGITTAELLDMTKAGEVTSDQLVQFAEELERRYGPQLAAALQSTTTQMGQLQNAAFQALLVFGKAGFIESFNGLLRDLTELLKSADFQTFAASASAAFGKVISLLGFLATNFDLVVAAMTAFVGFKIGGALAILYAGLVKSVGGLKGLRAAFIATQISAAASGASIGVATTAIGALRVALLALWSSTGVGVVLAAIGAAIGLWATRADEATEALTRHQEIVDKVKNAYDEADGSAEKFAKSIKDVTVSQATANLERLKGALQDIRDESRFNLFDFAKSASQGAAKNFFTGTEEAAKQHDALEALRREFEAGRKSAADYKTELDRIAQAAAKPEIAAYAVALQTTADRAIAVEKAISEAGAVIEYLKDPTDEAAAATAGLTTRFTEGSEAAVSGAKTLTTYNEAIEKLKEAIPGLAEELKKLKELDAINQAYRDAIGAARSIGQANAAWNAYQQALTGFRDRNTDFEAVYSAGRFGAQNSRMEELVRATTALAEQMGLSAKDLLAAMSFETGGRFDPSLRGGAGGRYLGLIQFSPDMQKQFGLTGNESITDQVIAAGKYLEQAGVKAGDGLMQIYAAILSGDARKLNASDTANGGVVSSVSEAVTGSQFEGHIRRAEGLLAAYQGITKEVQTQHAEQKKASEETEKQREQTKERLADGQFAIDQQALINQGKAREAEIEEAIRVAKEADPNITDAEIEKIREQAAALFDLKLAREEANNKDREALDLMREINAMMQQSAALKAQAAAEAGRGNTAGAQAAIADMTEVNNKLTEAIAKAREMWEAIGGPEAAAKLITLDALSAKLAKAAIDADNLRIKARENFIDWRRVGELFADGLVNAFDRFAQAVAEGKSASEAAREAFLQFAADFLRQIAQMILKALILKALNFLFPGLGFGAGHTGGVVGSKRIGSGNQTRKVNPMVFMGASRYHTGGLPGLRANEVPAILKKGEEVLSEDDPRNILKNGFGALATPTSGKVDLKIINAIDSGDFVSQGLATRPGQKAFVNAIRANADAVRRELGV